MRSRQEQASQTSGWWVYLPALGPAVHRRWQQARQLGERHIDDYFVVSSGDQPNTISLGLFKDPANARKRRDEVVAAGFPARMNERSETVPEYWLDLVVTERRATSTGAAGIARQQASVRTAPAVFEHGPTQSLLESPSLRRHSSVGRATDL